MAGSLIGPSVTGYFAVEEEPRQTSQHDTELIPATLCDEHWTRRISPTTKCLILLLLVMCIAGAVMVACDVNVGYWGGGDQWQWLDYLYFLSFVKVGVSVVKYIPQVLCYTRNE